MQVQPVQQFGSLTCGVAWQDAVGLLVGAVLIAVVLLVTAWAAWRHLR